MTIRTFVLAERLAVHVARALVRRRPADDRLDVDERRAVLDLAGGGDRGAQRVEVVRRRRRAGRASRRPRSAPTRSSRENDQLGRAVEGDVVVVVEVDEPPEPELAGQRRRLGRDALHEVAVGDDRVDAVVHDLGAVALAQEALGDRHADAVGEALAERAGGDLDAGRHVDAVALGMAGRERAPLAELLQLVQAQVVAAEVQRGVEQHRAVAGAEDEPVAVGPVRVLRVVVHDPRRRGGRPPGAIASGRPGCPLLDCWIASIASVRIVSMQSCASAAVVAIRESIGFPPRMSSSRLHVLVEIPKGSRNKYEWDEELQAIKLDRFLFSSVVYPTDYGFIPDALGEDGDPLDAMVCVTEPTFPGCVIPAQVVALFRMRDEGKIDDKVVCVPLEDPNWNHVKELDDLPIPLRDEISHFFSIYKQPEGKHVKVDGWFPREQALQVIEEAREREAAARAEDPDGSDLLGYFLRRAVSVVVCAAPPFGV